MKPVSTPNPPFLGFKRGQIKTEAAIFYAIMFAGTGASLPYMPLWFKSHGMSGAQIGLILALPLILRAISGPVIGLWADRFSLYRTPMALLALVAGFFYAGLWACQGLSDLKPLGFLIFYAIGYTAFTAMSPLMDSMTLQLASKEGFEFSTPRAIGSAAFIAAAVVMGYVVKGLSPEVVALWIIVAAFLSGLCARYLLSPKHKEKHTAQASSNQGISRIGVLFKDKRFIAIMLSLGLLQASHSFYYGFSTLIWKSQGISEGTCGLLWALGVAAEIAFMALGAPWRHRLGPSKLLVLAGVFAVTRWILMMLSPPLWLLWILQLLHALSFAATYMSGLELIARQTPKGYEGLAQTLNAAYGPGLMMGIATLASGPLYDHFGPQGYGLMAVVAGFGLMIALWIQAQGQGATASNPH